LSKRISLDRRAKTAITVLVAIGFFVVAATVRASIVALTPESVIATHSVGSEDEIVDIGGHTLLLRHGSAGNKIAHWLHGGMAGTRAFEVGGRSFVANSDALTPEGEQRVTNFAQMMTQVPRLRAKILISTVKVDPDLAHRRAEHLRADLMRKGLPASRIEIAAAPIAGGGALSKQPELVVVLSS
jgi:hypothetical protein